MAYIHRMTLYCNLGFPMLPHCNHYFSHSGIYMVVKAGSWRFLIFSYFRLTSWLVKKDRSLRAPLRNPCSGKFPPPHHLLTGLITSHCHKLTLFAEFYNNLTISLSARRQLKLSFFLRKTDTKRRRVRRKVKCFIEMIQRFLLIQSNI